MQTVIQPETRRKSSIKSVFALIVALSSAFAVGVAGNFAGVTGSNVANAAEPVRITTSFDVKYANAVLHQVTRLFTAGFGRAEADRVQQEIDGLKPDRPKSWQFTVQYQGKSEPLEIRAQMDDLGMIDLDFAASADAAPAVRAAVDSYLNGRGR